MSKLRQGGRLGALSGALSEGKYEHKALQSGVNTHQLVWYINENHLNPALLDPLRHPVQALIRPALA